MRISYNKWRRNYIGLLIIKSKDFNMHFLVVNQYMYIYLKNMILNSNFMGKESV